MFIIHRKIKNAIYAYEVTSYRDENGKPRNRQKCLGRVCEDGTIISKKRKLPAKIVKVTQITTKFILKNVPEKPEKPENEVDEVKILKIGI